MTAYYLEGFYKHNIDVLSDGTFQQVSNQVPEACEFPVNTVNTGEESKHSSGSAGLHCALCWSTLTGKGQLAAAFGCACVYGQTNISQITSANQEHTAS